VSPGRGRGDPALPLRAASALVLVPVALLIAWRGGWALAGFVTFFAVAMSYEWLRMSDPQAPPRAYSMFAAAVSGAAALAGAAAWGWVMAVIAAAIVLMGLERRARGQVWRAAFGAAYVALPCVALIWLRNGAAGGLELLLYLFAVVWAADTAAYFVGTWAGGPKLLPRASPNKTWSGLAAGLAAGCAAGAAFAALFASNASPAAFAALGAPLALAAVGGDLLESRLKRGFGVKDAGTLIPGHGGVLDRVDALMAAVLACAAMLLARPQLFQPLQQGLP